MAKTNNNRGNTAAIAAVKPLKKKKYNAKGSLLFYICFLVWPILQFAVFYIGVNFNSFLLAFKKIDEAGKVVPTFLDNFKYWFEGRGYLELSQAFVVSIKAYVVHLFIGVPLGILFSYYIFKRLPGSMFFRFMLFLPSILSALVLVLVFKFFIQAPFPGILEDVFGYKMDVVSWIGAGNVSFPLLMFYNIFAGFGTSVLLYSNKMSSISPDILEAADLDGVSSSQEFFHIVLPEAYSTISVFLITGVASIFINQYNVYPLLGGSFDSKSASIGYYMYDSVVDVVVSDAQPQIALMRTAALGLLISAIVIPVTFLVRHLLLKYGPSED